MKGQKKLFLVKGERGRLPECYSMYELRESLEACHDDELEMFYGESKTGTELASDLIQLIFKDMMILSMVTFWKQEENRSRLRFLFNKNITSNKEDAEYKGTFFKELNKKGFQDLNVYIKEEKIKENRKEGTRTSVFFLHSSDDHNLIRHLADESINKQAGCCWFFGYKKEGTTDNDKMRFIREHTEINFSEINISLEGHLSIFFIIKPEYYPVEKLIHGVKIVVEKYGYDLEVII